VVRCVRVNKRRDSVTFLSRVGESMLSPRKQVPLASGPPPSERNRANSSARAPEVLTKRAYFCSVVFELGHRGQPLPQGMFSVCSPVYATEYYQIIFVDVQTIIASLGTQLTADGQPIEYDNDYPYANPAASSTEALLCSNSSVRKPFM
jgi:hypothetical protein